MQPRSYKELPLRVGELGVVHRHEKSGQLHGLMRVRCFTQDDAHIFMTEEQIQDEIQGVVRLPMRFDIDYTGADGERHRPIMIHRVVYGSIERFIGILIEHCAGKFSVWLSPVQVKVLPVSDKYLEYAKEIMQELKSEEIRAELDDRDEKLGYKLREARMDKVPYMIIVGEKEWSNHTISVRRRDAEPEKQDMGEMPLAKLKELLRAAMQAK